MKILNAGIQTFQVSKVAQSVLKVTQAVDDLVERETNIQTV